VKKERSLFKRGKQLALLAVIILQNMASKEGACATTKLTHTVSSLSHACTQEAGGEIVFFSYLLLSSARCGFFLHCCWNS